MINTRSFTRTRTHACTQREFVHNTRRTIQQPSSICLIIGVCWHLWTVYTSTRSVQQQLMQWTRKRSIRENMAKACDQQNHCNHSLVRPSVSPRVALCLSRDRRIRIDDDVFMFKLAISGIKEIRSREIGENVPSHQSFCCLSPCHLRHLDADPAYQATDRRQRPV